MNLETPARPLERVLFFLTTSFYFFIFNVNKDLVLNETKSVASKVNSVFSFTANSVNYLTHIIMFSFVCKLLKLLSKIKNKK